MVRRVVALPLVALAISTLILGGVSLAFGVADQPPGPAKTVTTLAESDAQLDVVIEKQHPQDLVAVERGRGRANGNNRGKRPNAPTTTLATVAPTPAPVASATTTTTTVTTTTAVAPVASTTTLTTRPLVTTTTKAPPATTSTTRPPKATTTTRPPTTTTTAPPKQPPPPPSGDVVHIYPGDNVNAILQGHPNGTTFLMHAGTYNRVTLMPKTGQTIIGQKGTVLDGQGKAEDGVGRAKANDVTIRGLTIKNYKDKCIDWGAPGAGYNWTVEDTEVSHCRTGIKVKKGGTYKNNYVHHNRKYGMNGNGFDLTIVGNEIAFNRTDSSEWEGDSGGTKFLRTRRMVIRNNHVHDNHGNGIWVDGSNHGALIEKNVVKNNEKIGIFHELGFAPVIRNNTVSGNGFKTDGSGGSGSGIFLVASKDARVYNNTVTNNRNGIMAKWNDLHEGRDKDNLTGESFYLKNIHIHDNVITMSKGTTGIVDYSKAQKSYDPAWNNRFSNNRYKLSDPGGDFFRWRDANPNKAGYQLLNHDEWRQIHPKD